MDEKPIVSASFLTTAEDYRLYRCEGAHLSASPQSRVFFRVIGIVLLVIGIAGALMLSRNAINYLIWGFCLLAGLLFSFYYSLLEPFFVARHANREYEKIQAKLSAQTVELFPDRLHVENTRLNANYPYELIFRVVRTDAFFLFFLGQGDLRILPARLLDKKQCAAAAVLLTARLGDRYEDATTGAGKPKQD